MISRRTIKRSDKVLQLRSYEMSVWTLNDDYVSLLRPTNLDFPGSILDPEITLSSDGTLGLKFSIPMYILVNGNTLDNPLWINVLNKVLMANTRKIKVIFNKKTSDELVLEFVIVSMTESHNSQGLTCEIEATGLAFYELSKIGYKLAISEKDYNVDYDAWFDSRPVLEERESASAYNGRVGEWKGNMPKATLKYWNEKIHLENWDDLTTTPINALWYYKVVMDWSSYTDSRSRKTDEVYEEAYVSSWNSGGVALIPQGIEKSKIKERILEENESNLYNLSLKIAETFGVFCRYEYDYDITYHIIARRIVYYNNFIMDEEDPITLVYPYSSSEIKRTLDGNDIITKLYIPSGTVTDSEDRDISIVDSPANKTGEDYILNFEYLHLVESISEELYELVSVYETAIRQKNDQLTPIRNLLNYYYDLRASAEAALAIAEKSLEQDTERLSDARKNKNKLDSVDGNTDGYISINESNPRNGLILFNEKTQLYYINISDKGVLFSSVLMYTKYNYTSHTFDTTSGLRLSPGIPIYDEYDNLTRINNIIIPPSYNGATVFMTYSYSPSLYYDRIISLWETKHVLDYNETVRLLNELISINNNIELLEIIYNLLLSEKEEIIRKFNLLMGPALREGYWSPEDYVNCENKYDNTISSIPSTTAYNGSTPAPSLSRFIWDDNLFSDEDTITYKYGLTEITKKYLCIRLDVLIPGTDTTLLKRYGNQLDKLSIVYYDYNATELLPHTPNRARFITANASCKYEFVLLNAQVVPVLVVEACRNMTDTEINFMKSNGFFGIVSVNEGLVSITNTTPITSWLTNNLLNSITSNVYPRIEVNSYFLDTTEEKLSIRYNNSVLNMYDDYYVLPRDSKYYITIKPQAILKETTCNGTLYYRYILSDASTSIYLDGLEVAKENSQPKVSYNLTLSMFNEEFIHCAYKMLNRIININDDELKFENVQGYISNMVLNLDFPSKDSIEVKNYKNKFEDLFSSIVAAANSILNNALISGMAFAAFNNLGNLRESTLLDSLDDANLEYRFNDGYLTINEENGIEATSMNGGIVAIRKGGIYTTNMKDIEGNYVWKSAIVPGGVCAEAITAGTLNIGDIVILADSEIRFLMNKDGLFAYKSYVEDPILMRALASHPELTPELEANKYGTIDALLYVVHNSLGLFLTARKDDIVFTGRVDQNNNIIENTVRKLTTDVNRVEISWDGLIIRDWNNAKVFYADTNGNLNLTGNITCGGGSIAKWSIYNNKLSSGSGAGYVALQSFEDNSNNLSDYVFWAGAESASDAPFAIKRNGSIVMRNSANVTNEFTGTTGTNGSLSGTFNGTFNGNFTGKVTANNGFLGGDNSGLTINTGWIGDAFTGYAHNETDKTNNVLNVVFWAGSSNRNSANFKIFTDGSSYLVGSDLRSPSIVNGTIAMAAGSYSFEVRSGQMTANNVNIVNTNLGAVNLSTSNGNYVFNFQSNGTFLIKGASISGGSINVATLYLGSDTNTNIINSNSKIITSALADGATLTALKNCLDTTNSAVIPYTAIEYGATFKAFIEKILVMSDNKISWGGISTIENSSNQFSGTNFTINATKISISNNSGITINTTGFTLNNGVASIRGVVTSNIGSTFGNFIVNLDNYMALSGDLTYSLSFTNTGIKYQLVSSNTPYFYITPQGTSMNKLTLYKNETVNNNSVTPLPVLTISYTYNNLSYTVSFTANELAAYKNILGQVTPSSNNPCGYDIDPHIEDVVRNVLSNEMYATLRWVIDNFVQKQQ